MRKPEISKRLASSGSLDGLKKLVAEFYYTHPDQISFVVHPTHWQVQVGEKVLAPIVVQQGRGFVFGTVS